MLFQTATSTISDLGAVSSTAFNDIAPWVYLVAGIVLAFFIIEYLIDLTAQREATDMYAGRVEKEAHKILYE